MNRLGLERRAAIIRALVDGNSVRATGRIVGAAKGTILSLLADVGAVCDAYQRASHINLKCERIQVDEAWSFIGAKEKNASYEKKKAQSWGDAWTWVAICGDSKLVPTWMVAPRHMLNATHFMGDTCARLAGRVQISTGGASFYEAAVARAFTPDGVDYGVLRKVYGVPEESSAPAARRYSPPVVLEAERIPVFGNPDPKHISTSYVERTNLTMRMSMRRFTRLTNGFSKKLENHCSAIALHFMAYNYVKPMSTLSKRARGIHTAPAMAAGLTDRLWTCEDIARLLESAE